MADHFEEQEYQNQKIDFGVWKKILKTVLTSRKNVIGMLVFVSLLSVFEAAYPILNKYAIDVFFTEKNYDTFPIFAGLYVLNAIFFGLSVWGFIRFAGRVEVSTSYELRRQAYNKLQALPFSYFDRTPQGWVMARMTSDSRRLANIISWGLVDFLWGLLTMVIIMVVLFIYEWRLALIITALMPFLVTVAVYFRKKILNAFRESRKINSKITASYNEGFMGTKTTKSLVIEDKNNEEFEQLTFDLRKSNMRAIRFSAMFSPIMLVISYIGVTLTLYFGGNMVLLTILPLGTLYLFIDYTIRFFDPVMQLARILAEFQQAQASAERVVQLIETEVEIFDRPEVIEKYGSLFNPKKENWEELEGAVEFDNVTFKYNAGETVLKNFNLKVNAGQTVALVGHTGSGKSTIVNLISRFYEPTEGRILIDGLDYKDRSIGWLHSKLGYVLQSPHLFSGTVMENIRYGRLTATDEEVIEAAKVVNAHAFIEKLEKGYDNEVGEGGNKLSVGQKQLISFARAILAQPRLLILDEATSSIDTETEVLIQAAIDKLLLNRTSFVIAHRLSTIVSADLILVLEDGKIIESGSHRELLNQQGHYYNLYKNQFMKELEDKLSHEL